MRRGADYLADIAKDGRQVLLDGGSIADVTQHPGFAGPARTIASLYDGAADREDLTFEEGGIRSSAMWLAPRSVADLELRRAVHRHWAEGSFGLMGRTPDHVASIISAFAAMHHIFDRGSTRSGDHVVAFYEAARANDWFVSLAVTPPQVDRSRPAHDQPEPFLYPGILTERDDGIVIRGAQMIGTSAAIADYILISSIAPLQPGDEDYAISAVGPCRAGSTIRWRRASTNRTAWSCFGMCSCRGSTSSSIGTSTW
jgi:4-hydroxyphenylacetate 3-monooxygenase